MGNTNNVGNTQEKYTASSDGTTMAYRKDYTNDLIVRRNDRDRSIIFKGTGKIPIEYYVCGGLCDFYNGILYYKNGNPQCDKGDFYNNMYNGILINKKRIGTLYYKNCEYKYKGEFNKGLYHGNGTLYYENGKPKYKGEFNKGLYHGDGVLYKKSGEIVFRGTFNLGKRKKGKLYSNNRIKYIGTFYNNKNSKNNRYKKGAYYEYVDEKNVLRYNGEFVKGKYHGYGILYNDDGSVLHDGLWEKGCYRINYIKPMPKKTGDLLN